MTCAKLLMFAVLTMGLQFTASVASAATCTVQGSIMIRPLDTYYCDTDYIPSCANWREVDLDTTTKPLRFLYVMVTSTSGQMYGAALTNANGFYTMTFSLPSCSGPVKLHTLFLNVDPTSPTLGHFWIADENSVLASAVADRTLTGATSTLDRTFTRSGAPWPSPDARLANVYYSVSSAIDGWFTWSTNISQNFNGALAAGGRPRIVFSETTADTFADQPNWGIQLHYDDYMLGGTIRHELGHLVHFAMHHRAMSIPTEPDTCESLKLNSTLQEHWELGCEYGFTATVEGIATFIATRSIAPEDSNGSSAWWCQYSGVQGSSFVQHQCSQLVASTFLNPPPGFSEMVIPSLSGIGDTFATTTANCVRLRANFAGVNYGCQCVDTNPNNGVCDAQATPAPGVPQPCPDANADNVCDNYQAMGWRNETNVARFLWDVIDSANETSDSSNLSINQLVAAFESMPCTNGAGYGTDGQCNEPNRASPGSSTNGCVPLTNGFVLAPSASVTGTRDSYNARDLEQMISGNQTGLMTINCVAGAQD